MTKITKSEIELFSIKLLAKQGIEYIYAPSIAPETRHLRGIFYEYR